jgi:hypothetical protein
MFEKRRNVFAPIIIGFLFASASLSQSTFGSFTGTVKDPSGALIPGAEVEVVNQGTGTTRKMTTTSAGVFNVPNLDLGTYRVRVSAKGFNTYDHPNLVLEANQVVNLDVVLSLGTASNVVEVQGTAPVITTETADISSGVSHDSIEELPSVGRHAGDQGVYAFVTLTTGAASVPNSSTPIVNGTRNQVGILPTMDGIAVMAFPQGAGPVQPSEEGIQEVKMETAVAPAEFSTPGNIAVVSKSGTNEYHGGAFWDYNGNHLNARNFFSATVPFRVYHNFGGSFGGPIKKNKLFIYGDYEAAREAATVTIVETVPLPGWRNGDFSTGVTKPIIDPTNGQPFAGNIIPANRISKVSQNIQAYAYPLPNAGAPGALGNNWTANFPANTGFTHYDHFDLRGDYNVTSRDQIFVRYSWRLLPLTAVGIPYPLVRDQDRHGQSSVISWNHTISPAAFNEFRFGTTFHNNHYTANVVGSDLIQQFGIRGVQTVGQKTAPYFNITGVTPWNPGSSSFTYQANPETTLEWIDNLSWTKGRHFMKYGFDAVRDRYNGNSIGASVYGEYDFTSAYTSNGYADFLLGIPQTTSIAVPNPNRHLRGTIYGIYAQDQFKVSSRLTLIYGVRWQLEQPYSDNNGAIYTWNPATNGLVVMDNGLSRINPLYPKNIPITTASQAGYPASLVQFDKHLFEPRVGLAYKPFHGNNTVIRAGYGIYSNLIYSQVAKAMSGGPFSGSVTYNNAVVNGTPLFSFPSPFLTSGTTSVQNVVGVNPHLKEPYTPQWNVTIERQVASFGLRISYVGAKSEQLVYQRNLNLPLPSTIPFTPSRRPYQLYNAITYYDSGGTDLYNAMELAAQKRYGKNLTISTGFTWSKDLTDTQDSGAISPSGGTFAGQLIQNPNNRNIEKAVDGPVVPRRFFAYAVWVLPVGKGQRFIADAPAAVQYILGGWRTSWTAVLQNGQYYTPTFSGFDPSGTGTIGGIPDRIGNGNISNWSVSRAFDPTAFAIPGCPATNPVCSNPVQLGRWGNSGLNILQGPPIRNLDFALLKDFKYRDRLTLRFNMIMMNALNHPSFSPPAANISSPGTVGVISGQTRALVGGVSPREIDFGLRLMF